MMRVFRKKGIVETVFHGITLVLGICNAMVQVVLLRLRGYDIHAGVSFAGGNEFFQSSRGAIVVKRGTRFGKNTRINAGFNGSIKIGSNVLIDDGSFVMAQQKITIGDHTQISAYCFIMDFNHEFRDKNKTIFSQGYVRKSVTIGKDVWIGTHSVILPGVHIGDGAVIGAGSVVTHNVPAYTVVAGNPATILKRRT